MKSGKRYEGSSIDKEGPWKWIESNLEAYGKAICISRPCAEFICFDSKLRDFWSGGFAEVEVKGAVKGDAMVGEEVVAVVENWFRGCEAWRDGGVIWYVEGGRRGYMSRR